MAEISEAKLAELNEAAGRVPALEAERDEAVQRAEAAEALVAEATQKVKDADNKTAAAQIVDAALAGTDLPDVALDRVREAANLLPLTEDGDLDSEALTSAIESAVKRETDYIAAITPAHKIEGFGAVAEAATNERTPVNPWARKGA